MSILRRWFPLEEINGHGACPTYLYRWTLLRLGPIAVYLHHFVGDDWSLDLHDHPKRFVSIGLKGGYIEETPDTVWPTGAVVGHTRRPFNAPWIRTFPAEHRHRILMFRKHGFNSRREDNPLMDCWTLVIVGPKVREWGFWHRAAHDEVVAAFEESATWGLEWMYRWIPWREYVDDAGLVAKVKSCP